MTSTTSPAETPAVEMAPEQHAAEELHATLARDQWRQRHLSNAPHRVLKMRLISVLTRGRVYIRPIWSVKPFLRLVSICADAARSASREPNLGRHRRRTGRHGERRRCELARRGKRVLGLDRFARRTHGARRTARRASSARRTSSIRSTCRWFSAPTSAGPISSGNAAAPLMRRTGGVMIGPRAGVLVRGALASATEHDLPHEILNAAEVQRRYPAIVPGARHDRHCRSRGRACSFRNDVSPRISIARRITAPTLWTGTRSSSWRASAAGVEVTTSSGVASGGTLRARLGRVDRSRSCRSWRCRSPSSARCSIGSTRGPRARTSRPIRLPVFLLEHAPGRILYGMPELREVGAGVKVARHHEGESTDADGLRREVAPTEIDGMGPLLSAYTPALAGRVAAVGGLHVHEHAGRGLHHRPSSRARGGLARQRLLRATASSSRARSAR